MGKPLPAQVIVKPRLDQLNPESEWDDRDMVTGHLISSAGYVFAESGAQSIFFERAEQVRAWMERNGYEFSFNLRNNYMATSGLHGIYTKSDTTKGS